MCLGACLYWSVVQIQVMAELKQASEPEDFSGNEMSIV